MKIQKTHLFSLVFAVLLVTSLLSCGVSKEIRQNNEANLELIGQIEQHFSDRFSKELGSPKMPKIKLWARPSKGIVYVANDDVLYLTPYEKLKPSQIDLFNKYAHLSEQYGDAKSLHKELICKYFAIHEFVHWLQNKLKRSSKNPWNLELEANTITLLILKEENNYDLDLEVLIRFLKMMNSQLKEEMNHQHISIEKYKPMEKIKFKTIEEYWFVETSNILAAEEAMQGLSLEDYLAVKKK